MDAAEVEAQALHNERMAVKRERDALRAENERLRAALEQALEKATACAPADRLHELGPLWAVLDESKRA